MPTGSFSLALGGMANGAATGSAPTTAGADLDWLSRRSMDLFPRASFSLPHEPPLLPVPAPPPAPSPASAATSTTMSAPPASTPQQQQQQQLTSHLQSQQHLQLPPPPHGQYQHPAQSLQSQPSSGQPMLSMPPYHPSLTPPARMAQQQPQPPQQLQQQTQQMQQPQQSQQQPMQQQSQPSQQQPQQPPTFFGVSGPFVMNPGPYVMQNYLPPFATRAQQGANVRPLAQCRVSLCVSLSDVSPPHRHQADTAIPLASFPRNRCKWRRNLRRLPPPLSPYASRAPTPRTYSLSRPFARRSRCRR